jgi:hypothetical protein
VPPKPPEATTRGELVLVCATAEETRALLDPLLAVQTRPPALVQ